MMTLRARMLVGAAAFALVFATSTVVMMSAIGDLREAADRRVQSDRMISLAARIERLVVDLETGQRGFIITGQERFLQPWRAAQRELPERVQALVAAGRSEPQLGPSSTRSPRASAHTCATTRSRAWRPLAASRPARERSSARGGQASRR